MWSVQIRVTHVCFWAAAVDSQLPVPVFLSLKRFYAFILLWFWSNFHFWPIMFVYSTWVTKPEVIQTFQVFIFLPFRKQSKTVSHTLPLSLLLYNSAPVFLKLFFIKDWNSSVLTVSLKAFKKSSDRALVKFYYHLEEGQGLFFFTDINIYPPPHPHPVFYTFFFLYSKTWWFHSTYYSLFKSSVCVLHLWINVGGELYKLLAYKRKVGSLCC